MRRYLIGENVDNSGRPLTAVLESPGKPVTGSPSILKGGHNSLIGGSPSIIVSPVG